MSTEMKIGAGLGIFVVAISAWFFYTRSAGAPDIPLGDSQLAATDKEISAKAAPADSKPGASATKPAGRNTSGAKAPADNRTKTAARQNTTGSRPVANNKVATARDRQNADPATRRSAQDTPHPTPADNEPGKTIPQSNLGKPADTLLASTPIPSEPTASPGAESSKDGAALKTSPVSSGTRGQRDTGNGSPSRVAPVPARPPVSTPRAEFREHTVSAGDSFAKLAEQYYGTQRHTRYLVDANPQVKDPAKLSIGQILRIPPAPTDSHGEQAGPAKSAPTNPTGRTYVVRQGDSFYDIAARELGDGTRWPEVYELNKDEIGRDPGNIRAGQVLTIPAQ